MTEHYGADAERGCGMLVICALVLALGLAVGIAIGARFF
jgi:hypothetical protein